MVNNAENRSYNMIECIKNLKIVGKVLFLIYNILVCVVSICRKKGDDVNV